MDSHDKYGICGIEQCELPFTHVDYPGVSFSKSSFRKEWVDEYIGTDIRTILDIGAYDGGDSLRFNSWYPNAKIYTIEGSPHNFDVMNTKLGKRQNIRTFNVIISDVNGVVTFYQPSLTDGNGIMRMGSIYDLKDAKKEEYRFTEGNAIEGRSLTLDYFCKLLKITEIDIAHIDIEGATYNLVLGMNSVLPRLIFTEQEAKEQFKNKIIGGNDELIQLLKEKGYELLLFLGNDYLFRLKE